MTSSPVWKSCSSRKGATVTPEAGSPARASSRLGARGGFEGCRHVVQAAAVRRSTFGVLATRSCSRTANYGREATCARHDRASLRQARSRRAPKGSLEGLGSPGPQISQRPHAPAPYGTLAGLWPSSPNHFRILADTLRVICIVTSLPPPSAQWPGRSRRKERLGNHKGSRSLPRLGLGDCSTAWCASVQECRLNGCASANCRLVARAQARHRVDGSGGDGLGLRNDGHPLEARELGADGLSPSWSEAAVGSLATVQRPHFAPCQGRGSAPQTLAVSLRGEGFEHDRTLLGSDEILHVVGVALDRDGLASAAI